MQQQRSRFAGVLSLATALLIGGGAVANAQDWDFAGGDFHNQRNAAGEDTINPRNVHNLGLKWSIVTHGDVSATPTVEVQGRKTTVYAVDWGGYLYSIDGNTGSINWSFPLSTYTGYAGSVSRTSPAIIGRNLIIGDQGSVDFNGAPDMNAGAPTASVMAIDKQTGALIWRSIVSTHPFSVITSSPVADGARVYVGVASLEENAGFIPGYPGYSFRGSVVALDLHTGSQIWSYTTIPTSLAGYTGASVWGSNPVIDLNRQSLYVGTGNNYSTPAGLTTPHPVNPPEDHFDSILALDLHTGNLKWATRMQSWDTWDVFSWEVLHAPNLGPDYDFGSAPNLYTVHMHGKPVEILGAGEKSGKYWALNPDDGSIRWSTQVGPGGTGGGIEWGSAVDGQRVYCAVSNSEGWSGCGYRQHPLADRRSAWRPRLRNGHHRQRRCVRGIGRADAEGSAAIRQARRFLRPGCGDGEHSLVVPFAERLRELRRLSGQRDRLLGQRVQSPVQRLRHQRHAATVRLFVGRSLSTAPSNRGVEFPISSFPPPSSWEVY